MHTIPPFLSKANIFIAKQKDCYRHTLQARIISIILKLRRLCIGKRLDCKDFWTECDYAVCGRTEEEVLQKVGEHIQAVHAMKGF